MGMQQRAQLAFGRKNWDFEELLAPTQRKKLLTSLGCHI